MSLEREAKLSAAAGFRVPAMDGLIAGAVAVTRPRLELAATYYDSPELQLTRWDVTLRHRTGERGLAWMLKLPSAAAGQTLERQELRFAGDAAAVPPEAADLVRAYVRGRPLISVARLHTSRTPIEILGPDGTVLAEIADDAVSVREGRRVTGRFREIEIEMKEDSRKARDVVRAAVARLTAAGCHADGPVPKVIRALGADAFHPPEVVVSDLAAKPGPDELVRHAIAKSVVQLLRRDALVRLGDDEEGVHKFRVATRRLRSDLGTFIGFVIEGKAERVREELRWLGKEVGGLRDNQVLAGNLQRAIEALPAGDASVARSLLMRLQRQARNIRASMLAAMRTERYDRLLDELVSLAGPQQPLTEGGRPHRERDVRAMYRLVRKRWRRLAAAVDALVDHPPDAALHEVRIKAKRCRYAAEALAPMAGRRAARFAVAVSRLQTVLGEHQDTVVAERWLRRAAETVPTTCLVSGELIAHELAERARLRSAWPSVWKSVSAERRRSKF